MFFTNNPIKQESILIFLLNLSPYILINMYFLEAKDVVKQYSNHLALNNVSISVPEGKIFGLLGPNGAGKTTLIRIINRITAPDSGDIIFKGRKFESDDIYNIGYLPEERGLYKKMKVGEQAVYLSRLKGLSHGESVKRLRIWFEKFEINNWWNKKLEELSKGMQQKIQFITTIVHEPELLIFDEPFSGFDPVNTELLKKEILELKSRGKTIIFSTHNMASVEEICEEIALINKSKVVLQGNVQEIRSRFRTNIFKIGINENNVLEKNPALFSIIEEKNDYHSKVIRLYKEGSTSNSELIGYLSQKCDIVSFEEEIPSMNDIFIKTVS